MATPRSYLFLFLLPALALAACGGEKTTNENKNTVQEALPNGGYHWAGTYTSDTQEPGMFTLLVLKTDATFHATMITSCVDGRCSSAEKNGVYSLRWSDTLAYMEMHETSSRAVLGRYQYQFQGETLNLRKLGSTLPWTAMPKSSAAWCTVDRDCALQDLQTGPCAGQYVCTSTNTCNWYCGPAPEIARSTPKTGTGG